MIYYYYYCSYLLSKAWLCFMNPVHSFPHICKSKAYSKRESEGVEIGSEGERERGREVTNSSNVKQFHKNCSYLIASLVCPKYSNFNYPGNR